MTTKETKKKGARLYGVICGVINKKPKKTTNKPKTQKNTTDTNAEAHNNCVQNLLFLKRCISTTFTIAGNPKHPKNDKFPSKQSTN